MSGQSTGAVFLSYASQDAEAARRICDTLRAAGLDPARVLPVLTTDLQPLRPAPRPANSVLENKALAQAGFTLLDDFRIPLARLVQRLAN